MKRLLLCIVSAALAAACARHGGADLSKFTEKVYTPRYASGFEILGTPDGESTLIAVTDPWQGASGERRLLVIDRDGGTAPDAAPDVQRIDGDAARIVCMSSTHVAMLGAVGCSDRIAGVSGIDFISDPYVASHRDRVRDIGFEPNVDYETLAALDPDIVLLYGVTGPSGMESKLRELGIPYIYMGEYVEESPLGKAEWTVAAAEIAGCRRRGEEFFSQLPPRYDSLKRAAAAAGGKPRVMINAPYGDNWFMPSTRSYMARLIADAGGDYLYSRNTSNKSETIDMEQAYLLLSKADRWINVGQISSLAELRDLYPKLADAPCVGAGHVYNCNRRTTPAGGNDYWESGVVKPDTVLRDLIAIFHPELAEGYQPYYYRPIE